MKKQVMTRKRKKIKFTLFDIINYLLVLLIGIITLFPFVNTIAIALNDGMDTMRGGISFFPRKFTIDNILVVLSNERIIRGFGITVARTVVGTFTSVLVTGMLAYGLSKPYLVGRKFYMMMCLVTMYFSGGLIPSFLLTKNLHLINNFLVFIIPALVNVWNMILMHTYFRSIPQEIEEAAKIDGARDFRIFFKIIIPVSKPIIAVVTLYNAVSQWNSWFDAYLFITKEQLRPLQSVLIDIINSISVSEMLPSTASFIAHNLASVNNITSKSVTAATMLVTVGPIIFIYPFVQKYFVKGIMIGSVKS